MAEECEPCQTAASRASREGGGAWETAGTPLWAQELPIAEGHVGAPFQHGTLDVGCFEVSGTGGIGTIGYGKGGDASSKVIRVIFAEVEVNNVGVKGGGDDQYLETKAGGTEAICQ